MRKKGRPAKGVERYLTKTEIDLTGLDKGLIISVEDNDELCMTRRTRHGFGIEYTNTQLIRARKKLFEFWEEDNGNGK